jgi:hypothetical protein
MNPIHGPANSIQDRILRGQFALFPPIIYENIHTRVLEAKLSHRVA